MIVDEAVESKVTLGNLINTYSMLYDSSTAVRVASSNAAEDKEKTAKTFAGSVRSTTGHVHKVTIKLGKDTRGLYSLSSPCKVDCDCKTYVFRNNEPLAKAGAALYVRYTKSPSKTGRKANPDGVVTCCKHIFGYVSFLLRRGDAKR